MPTGPTRTAFRRVERDGRRGVANVFRYAFDKPAEAFADPLILGIAFAADGTALVLTPPPVNTIGFDFFSILAMDDLLGAPPTTLPLAPNGTNAVPASASPACFFRLKMVERRGWTETGRCGRM